MILLVTYFPWDHACGGAFIMRSNLDLIGEEPVHWLALSRPAGHVPYAPEHVSREHRVAPAYGNARLRLRRFWLWYYRRVWAGQTASVLMDRVTKLKPRLIWLLADFGLVPVGLRLLERLRGHRLHVSVHDHPEWTSRRERVSAAFTRETQAFLAALAHTDFTADAVSEELLEATVPSARRKAIITLPVDSARAAPELTLPGAAGVLTLGFSGNFLGDREFRCLIDGLRSWSQRTGRDWRMLAFGNEALSQLDPRIQARGFTAPEEVRSRLRACDALFLPCPIDSPEMMTSLPTKLISYVEAGRPVLAFAPAGSATERIIGEAGIGCVLTRRDAAEVASCIDELARLEPARAARGRNALIEERFSRERIARDLRSVLA